MNRVGLYSTLDIVIAVIGVVPFAFGVIALLKPLSMAPGMALKITTPEGRKIAEDMYKVYAARNITLGSVLLTAVYFGNRQVMGVGMLGAALMAFIDGAVTGSNKKGGEWQHWPLVPVGLGLAARCFGYI